MAKKKGVRTRTRTVTRTIRKGYGRMSAKMDGIIPGAISGALGALLGSKLGSYGVPVIDLGVGYMTKNETLMTIGGRSLGASLAQGIAPNLLNGDSGRVSTMLF
jgi:hypothetical protein